MLERPVLHHNVISRFFAFQDGGCPPSWIFEIEIFNCHALQRHVLDHSANVCEDQSYCWRDVAFFYVFLVKCKN